MIHKVAKKIVDIFVMENVVEKENAEIYEYGAAIFIATSCSILGVLIIGGLTGKFLWSALFLVTYCSIRWCAGGYHADSFRKCIITFLLLFTAGTICDYIFLPILEMNFIYFLFVVSNICIFLFAPVEALNNPLPDQKKGKMKKRALQILNVWLVILWILQYERSPIRGSICWAIIIIDFVVFVGNIKNSRRELDCYEDQQAKNI